MTGFRVPGPGRIHVFCEGETEVLYLQDFCRLIGLSGKKAVISVCPVKNPARAIEWICRQVPGVSKASAASPECWLVFDRDRHEGFHEAFELVKQHPCIHLAATKPCFEYWLLLHFDDFQDDLPLAQGWYVAKRQVQGKQVAPDRSVRMTMEFLERVAHPEAVLKRLKKHMPGYGKNKAGVFEQLFPFLGTALLSCGHHDRRCCVPPGVRTCFEVPGEGRRSFFGHLRSAEGQAGCTEESPRVRRHEDAAVLRLRVFREVNGQMKGAFGIHGIREGALILSDFRGEAVRRPSSASRGSVRC